jgi:hypothetical protein
VSGQVDSIARKSGFISASEIVGVASSTHTLYIIQMERELLDKVFYSLSYEDIQNIAEEDLGRELTENEIESVVDEISNGIDWAGTISDALLCKFKPVEFDDGIRSIADE